MGPPIATVDRAPGGPPLVATALHHGHWVRREVARLLAVDGVMRRHEEDPYSGLWTIFAPTRVVGRRSRFEVDLNRPRGRAVYMDPEDAWGIRVWKRPPPPGVVQRSLAEWDAFHDTVFRLLDGLQERHGRFVVLDLHSYNHRRLGPDAPPEDPEQSPDINVGTGTMDRERWAPVVDRFLGALRGRRIAGRRLDVRENVRFFGGHFPEWIHRTFPASGCALAVEVKKFFMDEWSGSPELRQLRAIRDLLASVEDGVLSGLKEAPG